MGCSGFGSHERERERAAGTFGRQQCREKRKGFKGIENPIGQS